MPDASPLPYTDSKPVGAADFYMAINATFRFIHQRFGMEGLRRYWHDLGSQYFAPVSQRWAAGGLEAVADYWRAFFAAEPGAKVEVTSTAESVTLEVQQCPALKHLREQGREVLPCFCQHCYFISESIGAAADISVRVKGGAGSCTQTFAPRTQALAAQDLSDIREVLPC